MAFQQDFYSHPLNYEQLILEQLEKFANDLRGDDKLRKTISNVAVMGILTWIDHDKEYDDAIRVLENKKESFIKKGRMNRNGKRNPNIFMEADFDYAMEKMEIIMECLKRRNRFPVQRTFKKDQIGRRFDEHPAKPNPAEIG